MDTYDTYYVQGFNIMQFQFPVCRSFIELLKLSGTGTLTVQIGHLHWRATPTRGYYRWINDKTRGSRSISCNQNILFPGIPILLSWKYEENVVEWCRKDSVFMILFVEKRRTHANGMNELCTCPRVPMDVNVMEF